MCVDSIGLRMLLVLAFHRGDTVIIIVIRYDAASIWVVGVICCVVDGISEFICCYVYCVRVIIGVDLWSCVCCAECMVLLLCMSVLLLTAVFSVGLFAFV